MGRSRSDEGILEHQAVGVAGPRPQIDERQLQSLWIFETRNQQLPIAKVAHFKRDLVLCKRST